MKQNSNIIDRTISDFLDKEYRGYANYTICNRACPSLVDGFKTGARKIMHAAMKGSLKNGETKKVTNLAGETMNYSLYQHGDSSLNGTIITLSQFLLLFLTNILIFYYFLHFGLLSNSLFKIKTTNL